MNEQLLQAVAKGMEVYTADDDKLGSVGAVYRPASAVAATGSAPASYTEAAHGAEPRVKVDTGVFGLGKDLFIPASAIADVTGNRVTLSVNKAGLGTMEWDRRPDWIPA